MTLENNRRRRAWIADLAAFESLAQTNVNLSGFEAVRQLRAVRGKPMGVTLKALSNPQWTRVVQEYYNLVALQHLTFD